MAERTVAVAGAGEAVGRTGSTEEGGIVGGRVSGSRAGGEAGVVVEQVAALAGRTVDGRSAGETLDGARRA